MNGELAQSFAIATHVTAWLAESRTARARPGESPGVPSFVDIVAFDSVAGVDEWVDRLARSGVKRLWLAVPGLGMAETPGGLDPHLSAAFAGGMPVGLLSTGPAGNRLWQSHWQVGARVPDGAQIAVANYESQPVSGGPARIGVDAAADALDRMLQRAAEFAGRQQLPRWAKVFADARRRPAGDGSGPDLFPASWPDADSRRLAGMARSAWVFGGMGSWNDLGFADGDAQGEYEQLSRQLFDAVMRACVAAVNVDWRP